MRFKKVKDPPACPKCGSIMEVIEDKNVLIYLCSRCGYSEEFKKVKDPPNFVFYHYEMLRQKYWWQCVNLENVKKIEEFIKGEKK